MNAQMRLVIMLTSVAVSGSILFAAEPAQKAPEQTSSEQKTAEEKPAVKPAEQKPAEQKTQTSKTEPAATAADESKAPTRAEDEDPAPKRAATPADRAGSPQRFSPSEQVRADFDVSFPIDI